MPILQSFRATVYASSLDLAEVTSPPYDLISPAERDRLQALHPHNIVHLTLGGKLGNGTSANQYRGTARRLRDWMQAGILVRDDPAAMYLYRMDYRTGGLAHTTAGVVGTLTLEGFGEGGIFPHERTFPGPVADRLRLMRAAHANLEPIWLVAAASSEALGSLPEAPGSEAVVDYSDAGGIRHRLWRVPPDEAGRIGEALSTTPLVIADGHHRYSAALAFRDEKRTQAGAGPWDQTLALISDPVQHPPTLLPIHRAAEVSIDQVAARVELVSFAGDLDRLASHVQEAGPGTVGVVSSSGCWTTRSAGLLDAAWIGTQVLEPLGAKVSYQYDLDQLSKAIASGSVGFLLAPVPLRVVVEAALAGRLMPQKTTLFWPKPRTGLLLRNLEA